MEATQRQKAEFYQNLKSEEKEIKDCFFAFSDEQLKAGIKRYNLEGQKLFNGGMGLIGTAEGLKEFKNFYIEKSERIKKECDPQAAYIYEYHNHESSYTGTDEEAINIIENYFGEEAVKSIKRKKPFEE